MQKLKFLSIFAFVLGATLPWNATAISQNKLTPQQLVQSYGTNLIESLLAKTLFEIRQGKTSDALDTVNQLIQAMPNFKLAYLIRGDLLSSRARSLSAFGDAGEIDKRVVQDYQDEVQTRLTNYLDRNKDRSFPDLLMQLDESQRYALVVDTSKSRLYVYAKNELGQLKYMSDYYITIGKNGIDKKKQGDKRTPIGVYFASSKLNRPLPDLYGEAAYPLSYPNEIDSFEKRNGSGIWIHGTPTDTYSRPPRASDGCVVLSNPDIKALQPILDRGNTPVIIVSEVNWVEKSMSEARAKDQQLLNDAIEQWRKDWVSQDTKKYLSHYSTHFFYSDGDFEMWADHKQRIQASKPKVSVDIDHVSMFSYPNADKSMVVVDFEQSFTSSHLKNKMKKRQYWINENNQWRILYEGAA
ncbi:MAG: L,D-transpeptidase family protein [Methylophilus sp.]